MSMVESLGAFAETVAAADALDLSKLAEVEKLLGEAAAANMLGRLRGDIATRLSNDLLGRAETNEIAAAAHAMVSSAGFLGFAALSGACASLERACRQDLPIASVLISLVAERDRALSLLDGRAAAAA